MSSKGDITACDVQGLTQVLDQVELTVAAANSVVNAVSATVT